MRGANNPGVKCTMNNKGVKGERKEEYLLPCLSESKNPKLKEMERQKMEEGHIGRKRGKRAN